MKGNGPVTDNAFNRNIITLADVATGLDRAVGLSDTRRRDLRSAVRRVARLMDLPEAEIAVDVAGFRKVLSEENPQFVLMGRKTRQNLKSNFAAALDASGARRMLNTARVRLCPAWAGLHGKLPDK